MPLTCSHFAVGPHQVFALGHNHCEALCCRQIAERQQDLPNCIHSLQSQVRVTVDDITVSHIELYVYPHILLQMVYCSHIYKSRRELSLDKTLDRELITC